MKLSKLKIAGLQVSLLLSALLISVPQAFAQNQFQITTYWPVPVGVFNDLRLVPRDPAADPAIPACDGSTRGMMYVDSTLNNTLFFCSDSGWGLLGGVWSINGDDIFLTDTTTNPNLKVGIGLTDPMERADVDGTEKLEIFGNVRIEDGMLIGDASGVLAPFGDNFRIKVTNAAATVYDSLDFHGNGTGSFLIIPETDTANAMAVFNDSTLLSGTETVDVSTLEDKIRFGTNQEYYGGNLAVDEAEFIIDDIPELYFDDTTDTLDRGSGATAVGDTQDDDFLLSSGDDILGITAYNGGSSNRWVTVNNTGYLGIGYDVSPPEKRLHLYGFNGNTEPTGIMIEDTTNLSSLGYISQWQAGVFPNKDFFIWGSRDPLTLDPLAAGYHDYTRMVVDEFGRVGIGTSDPEQPLHIGPNAGEGGQLQLEDGFPNIFFANIGAPGPFGEFGDWKLWAGDSHEVLQLDFYNDLDGTRNKGVLTITQNGHVGIGTSTPLSALHVDAHKYMGDILMEAPAPRLAMSSNAFVSPFRLAVDDALDALVFEGDTAGTFTHRMVIKADTGRIGIGTDNPLGTLHIEGEIFQRGALIDAMHADYVFEPEYELESIDEHAEYMWKNKHLEAIPSPPVDENGIKTFELGRQNRGIVEELEKAHIYIEQLNERIKYLENFIENYEKENVTKTF